MKRSAPTALEAAASPVRVWQDDVRSAAGRMVLPEPGELLPALQVGVLQEPIDLAALIGSSEPGSAPDSPLTPPLASGRRTGGLRPAPRVAQPPPRRSAPPSVAPLPAGAGAPARQSRRSPERWPSFPGRLPAPVPPTAHGVGAARLAVMLQRYEAQAALAASASAAVGRFPPHSLPGGSSPRSHRAHTGPSRREPPSPASVRGSGTFVSPSAGSAIRRGLADANARGRTSLARLEDAVSGRLRRWSQGMDVPPPPSLAPAADVVPPTRLPVGRPPSPGSSATPGGALREVGFAPAGRRRGPATEIPASPDLARLIDLVEQAVSDIAAVDRRLAETGAREVPQVQWLEDDELAGRLQGILARQARRRGIDLS